MNPEGIASTAMPTSSVSPGFIKRSPMVLWNALLGSPYPSLSTRHQVGRFDGNGGSLGVSNANGSAPQRRGANMLLWNQK